MSEINSLPSSPFWSLVFKKDQFFLLSEPKTLKKIYLNRVEDVLTESDLPINGQEFLESYIRGRKLFQSKHERSFGTDCDDRWLIHLFYEAGHLWNKGAVPNPDQLLGIIVEYQEETPFDPALLSRNKLSIEWEKPDFQTYRNAFELGKSHLKNGDCYQYNLTFPFKGRIGEGDLETLIHSLWAQRPHVGEFAHITFLENEFYITNTPECLFEWHPSNEYAGHSILESRPIKGTLKTSEDPLEIEDRWQQLRNCEKNESELYMITDLIRNDLNRIEKPKVEILEKKALLKVPGLIHSYSHLRVPLSENVDCLDILKSLFPGGSITGAPKIRVMEIIKELEVAPRGFYCGSTIMARDNSVVGSINIRAAHGSFDKGEITYHAGGGVTWDSSPEGEYEEMDNKFLSFNSLLTLSLN